MYMDYSRVHISHTQEFAQEGDMSMARGTLIQMKEAVQIGFDYYINLNDGMMPIKTREEITAFLEEQNSVDAEEVFLRKEKKEFMYMVLRRFRKEQPINYEILIQVKYLEISVETVAEEYGLTKSGVNNRIYKAKRWLQEEFRKVYE